MRRLAAIVLLIAAFAPLLWFRTHVPRHPAPASLRFVPLDPQSVDPRGLGPFRLEKAWRMIASQDRYGGFSGLFSRGDGRLFAVSDGGVTLEFSAPDASRRPRPVGDTIIPDSTDKYSRDVEAASYEPLTGRVWLALEFRNTIARFDYRGGRLKDGTDVRPSLMRHWGNNQGPESLVRLRDGRYLTLREGFTGFWERSRHQAVLFAGDPVEKPGAALPFTFVGPEGYKPTDAALLPDGRVLVLLRKINWPMPPRFGGAIAIGDPRTIRKRRAWPVRLLASWGGGYPADNFEGMTIEPPARDAAPGDPLTIWLISDDNRAALQSTMLWKLQLDPADLPPALAPPEKQKGAR